MKRVFGVLLAAVMLFSMTLPIASAAGTPTVSISSGQAKPGESVTLTVSIKDNPGLAAYKMYVYYDTDVFDIDIDSDIDVVGKFASRASFLTNTIAVAKSNGRYDGMIGKDGIVVLWFSTAGQNTTSDGEMLTISLTVKSDAPNGDYQIGLGYSASNTSNENEENVALNMAGGVVTISGGKTNQSEQGDTDIPEFPDAQGHWAQSYIERAAELGLILGNEYGMYMPDKTMTRAECVTILWRACGSPKPTKSAGFTDLDPEQIWYHDAVAWAAETGIVKGIGENKFSPLGTVNRDQLATILYRMAGGVPGEEIMYTSIYDARFTDIDKVASWAKNGLYWTIFNKIYCGVNSEEVGETLAPEAPALRSQIAVMIVRYLEDQGGN